MVDIKLSAEQELIANCPIDSHAVVLAVAGSGKSAVLVERIARLYELHKVAPAEIVAVMFNNDAAKQLHARLVKRMGRANAPQSLTFHGLGTQTLALLAKGGMADAWKFDSSPNSAIKFAMDCLNPFFRVHQVKRQRTTAELFLGFVDRVKSDLVPPYDAFKASELDAGFSWFVSAYDVFEKKRQKTGIRFFSDLIYDAVTIVESNSKAAELVADRYAHVVVDEYQDICESQQRLVQAVAGTRARVMVVGDDDQTIYTWRGAKPSYILRDFQKKYVGAKVFNLSRTWRYGHVLSVAANHVIKNNYDRADKLCLSVKGAPKTQVKLVYGADSGADEKSDLSDLLVKPYIDEWLRHKDSRLGDIVILSRTFGRTATTQLELLGAGIPFRIQGGESVAVLANPWVKSLIGWLRLATGHIAQHPYSGEPDYNSISRVLEFINPWWMGGLSWDDCKLLSKMLLVNPNALVTIDLFRQSLPASQAHIGERLKRVAALWDILRGLKQTKTALNGKLRIDCVSSVFEVVKETLDMEKVIGDAVSNQSRLRDQAELLEGFVSYAENSRSSAEQFFEHTQDLLSFSKAAQESVDAVLITSVHRSKGLEWPCVIIAGLRQGWFPFFQEKETQMVDPKVIDDERRLFYVAMTRAKHSLYLIAPSTSIDPRLPTAVRIGATNVNTASLERGKSASQFLYEMNYHLSLIAGSFAEGIDVGDGVGSFRSVGVANEYMELLGLEKRYIA